jgi:hypothetical protein
MNRWEPFGTVSVEYATTLDTSSDGDLWPSTWADDDNLYTANGDGAGFAAEPWSDIVVNRIAGTPGTGLSGERLASGRDVSPIWGDPARFNCKPTGIVAVDGNDDGRDELYLAVQDLAYGETHGAFDHAPAASIVSSLDYGATWTSTSEAMFPDGVFTTIMFLDFGKSNGLERKLTLSETPFVYAYGLDGNWRTSYSQVVDDPTCLYLTRVDPSRILDRDAWELFAGADAVNEPRWTRDIASREPVLRDDRRLYIGQPPGSHGHTPLAQGGVVYNAGLNTFIYTSWTEYTFQFYAAPTPWGPWALFHEKDFGPYPWAGPRAAEPLHGGYGTSIPSKFISADGRDMWLQSNWFWRSSAYTGNTYRFSLRRVRIEPRRDEGANDRPDGQNLAMTRDAVPISTAARAGHPEVLIDGKKEQAEDSWNGTHKDIDFWGVTWPRTHRMNTVVCTWGPRDYIAGWFDPPPTIQARVTGSWRGVSGLEIQPRYNATADVTNFTSTTFTFDVVEADGIRVIGRPGGSEAYTAIAEFEVYLR